jgi:hypothetical protein
MKPVPLLRGGAPESAAAGVCFFAKQAKLIDLKRLFSLKGCVFQIKNTPFSFYCYYQLNHTLHYNCLQTQYVNIYLN